MVGAFICCDLGVIDVSGFAGLVWVWYNMLSGVVVYVCWLGCFGIVALWCCGLGILCFLGNWMGVAGL